MHKHPGPTLVAHSVATEGLQRHNPPSVIVVPFVLQELSMNFRIRGVLASVALLAGAVSSAFAAPVPVTVDLSYLRAIQTATLVDKADDQAYALVSGIAAGKEFHNRLPAEGK